LGTPSWWDILILDVMLMILYTVWTVEVVLE